MQAYNSSSPQYQPALHKHLRSKGVQFDQHYVTTPVCCPSRTNILLGKYSHNTNMTDVFPPHGEHTAAAPDAAAHSTAVCDAQGPGRLPDTTRWVGNCNRVGRTLSASLHKLAERPSPAQI